MSKKTLLNETQVRRFMKLANVGALTDGFVDNLSEAGYFDDPLEEQEDELPGEDDEGMGDMDADAAADMPDLDAPEADAMGDDMDDDMGDAMDLDDAAGESLPPEVVAKVEDALAAALGAMEQELEDAIPELDLSVEQGDDMGDMDAMADEPMGDMGDMDAMADEPMGDEPADEPDEPMGDMDAEPVMEEDELVETIVKRVAARLRELK